MSYQSEREAFIATMIGEGLTLATARKILRHAQTIQRCAERECSDERADRDRVECPGLRGGVCLCEHWNGCGCPDIEHPTQHHKVTRIARQSSRCEQAIVKALDGVGCDGCGGLCSSQPFKADFSGDPRGACVKIVVPSGKTDDWGRTGICVPTRG